MCFRVDPQICLRCNYRQWYIDIGKDGKAVFVSIVDTGLSVFEGSCKLAIPSCKARKLGISKRFNYKKNYTMLTVITTNELLPFFNYIVAENLVHCPYCVEQIVYSENQRV